MASEWKECTLAELGEIVGGATPSTKDESNYGGDIAWITPKDLSTLRGRFIAHGERNITEKGLNSCSTQMMPTNAVLFSSRAPIGYVAIAKNPVCTNQGFKSIVANADNDPMFLYYLLKYNKDAIEAMGSGTTFKEVSGSTMRGIRVRVPVSKAEQQRIASVLAALDSKIENNDKINDNLLQQAQSVFTDWFVRFTPFANDEFVASPIEMEIPKSLSMIQIGDVPHILETGRRPKGGAADSGIPSVGAENVKQLGKFDFSSKKFIPEDFATKQKTGRIKGYELLLYKDGGKPGTFIPHFSMFGEGFPYTDFFINEHVFKLDFFDRGKNIFAYFYMQTDYATSWLANNGGKAAIPGINQQDVRAIWIYDMDHPQVQQFCRWVEPLFKTIFCNCYENMRLADLRDTLLPKLISGEIDVSSVEL